jgi:hypothetical protein
VLGIGRNTRADASPETIIGGEMNTPLFSDGSMLAVSAHNLCQTFLRVIQ